MREHFLPEKMINLLTGILFNTAYATGEIERFGLENEWWTSVLDFSWMGMSFVLGLVDGFNPCAMWTLFILLGFLFSIQDTKKRWLIGGVFISSSAIIYLVALFTYLFGFKEITENIATSSMQWIFSAIGIIAILTGLITFYNSKDKGIECDVRDNDSKKKFSQHLRAILAKEKLFLIFCGVIVLAFSVNAFELLCSFAIPTIFTSTLVSLDLPTWKNITALLVYDFAYVLDDIIVFSIAIKTLSLKVFDKRLVQITNVIGAVLLILIGGLLVFNSKVLIMLFV